MNGPDKGPSPATDHTHPDFPFHGVIYAEIWRLEARKGKKLSQEQLGALVGVQKAQISKIENNTKNFRLVTILPVMDALGMKVRLSVEYENEENLVLSSYQPT